MIEYALLFDREGRPLAWYAGADSSSIPDSRTLWGVVWDLRDPLGGVAHTHPWSGSAAASHEDLTTFSAIERGLGRRLIWPVVTMTAVRYYVRDGVFLDNHDLGAQYVDCPPGFSLQPHWEGTLEELRRRSCRTSRRTTQS